MKLRYWLDFGSRESSGYFVKWRDTKNNRGEVTHHLIQVFASQDDNDEVQLFTLNLYNLKKKIMIQGSHKELWKDREFNILKNLVDDCIHNKDLSESYFIVTGVRINIECSDELDPSDNEEEFPVEEAQGEESHDRPMNVVSGSDDDEVDIKPKNQCIKSRTPLRKRKGLITPRRNKLKKAIQEKKTERKQKPKVIKKESEMELRLRNLEEVTCRIDSVIASQLSNSIVMHEDTIEEIVKLKIDQQLKDLKEQQKNVLAVLRDKICNLENHFESEISSLKSEIEKIRSKNTNVNERCGKMEKCIKENKILLEKVENNMKVRLYELKDELDSTHASNIKIDAGTETESNELVQENKLNYSTEHKSDPVDIPSSVHQSIERFRSKRNSADIVVLMDSNRCYMDFSYLFPEKQVRVIPCGSVERARTIINNPRFFDVEAIIIHTGTNDLEDNSLSSRHIANTLIEISETALNRFPNSKIFLSEITPRRDDFHLKGMEVNSMIKGAIESNNFQLVCHSNLSKESLFFDKKHLNKFSGVRMLANNFGEWFAKSFSNWMIKKATIVQQRHLRFVRKPSDPSQQIPTQIQESFQSGNRQTLFTPQSVYQQPLSYARVVSPQEKPQNSVSSTSFTDQNVMSEMLRQLSVMTSQISTLINPCR